MNKYATNLTEVLTERVDDLAKTSDPKVVKEIIAQSKAEAKRRTPIYFDDLFVYRITVSVLGLAVLSVIYAQYKIVLIKGVANIPDGIIAIGSAAIGALAGLLAPTSSNSGGTNV